MSRDDLVTTNEKIVGSVTEEVVKASPDAIAHRRLEPARRDVPRGEERLRLAEGARLRHGGDPRHGALPRLHRLGDRRVDQGRADARARRPRRPDGARRLGDDRRRRAAAQARRRRPDRGDGAADGARAAARSSTCSAPRPGTRRARRPRRWSTRSCSTRSACSRARRTSRASTAIDGLYIGVPVKLGAGGVEEILEVDLDDAEREALEARPTPCARSSASSRPELRHEAVTVPSRWSDQRDGTVT